MSLNLRIFKLLCGIVGLTTAAILIVVWLASHDELRQRVQADMDAAQTIARQAFNNRQELLFNAADVLVADFGFRQSVSSAVLSRGVGFVGQITMAERDTIVSVLENHGQRINADVMAVVSVDGEVLATNLLSLRKADNFIQLPILERTIANGGAIINLAFDDSLYQIIMLVIEAPNPIAIAMVGFEIDQSLLGSIASITNKQIAVYAPTMPEPTIVSSLTDAEDAYVFANAAAQEITQIELGDLFAVQDEYVRRSFVLGDEDQTLSTLRVALFEPIETWLDPLRLLMIEIIATAALLMLISLATSLVFARKITRPLDVLAQSAKRIAAGDYSTEFKIKTNARELDVLSDSLDDMRKDIQDREAEIQYQANHDLLTGLLNRYAMTRVLAERLEAGEQLKVISFRLTDFRALNNAFGFGSGDAVLLSLSERVRGLQGQAARINGSELLWLPDRHVAETELLVIKDALAAPHVINDVDIQAPLVAGYIELPGDIPEVEALFRQLSIAVEQAQHDAAGLLRYEAGMEEAYLKRLAILRGLEHALTKDPGELHMVYQPKFDLETNVVSKFEALIRWQSKELGFVPPDVFIPIAERAGLINQVTEWVVRSVINDLSAWREALPADDQRLSAAINLSVHDVADADLMGRIVQLLDDAKLTSQHIEFELTESDLMGEPAKAIAHMTRLRDAGFALSIDDFGTGYSSLAYLKNMPVGALKIDKSFVLKLDENEEDQMIVSTIIDLAKRFGLHVVAEGIETEQALNILREWGCKWAQGYFISKPMKAAEVLPWLQHFHAQQVTNLSAKEEG